MSKKIVSLFLALLMALSMTTVLAESITITDMFGREVTLTGPVTHIVAMEPSDCEILCALGCEEALVGRGAYCDYPASLLDVPAVQSGTSINLEEILALNPQVVVVTGMAHLEEQIKMLVDNGVQVIGTDANSIDEVYDSIRLLGLVMDKDAEAEAIIADMKATFDDIASKSEKTDKTIYFEVMPLEWGLWSAGTNTFMHELAELCGMHNAFADIEGWQSVSQEQVIERNPDYIVLVTGMGEAAPDEVKNRDGWGDMDAVRNNKIYNADSYMLTRPAPRLKDAAIDLYNFLNDIVAEEAPAA
ncbi:MAG: ABC transporter substrate-binding protein [Clostridia bacterium]|nr:ABC transporter substrate-binding protein [Clostridia bacterium]